MKQFARRHRRRSARELRAGESEVSIMSHIEQLIGRQIELGEIRRRLEQEHRRPAEGLVEESRAGPCIAISREFGSDGTRLARAVGERLNWKVFDKEIVDEVARHAHVRNQLVECVDEPTRSSWRRRESRLSTSEVLGRREYLYHLEQVILALGHLGSAVLVGRGAHLLLAEPSTVRVRVVAPLVDRIRRVAEHDHVTLGEAERRVETVDGERAAFVRNAFGQEISAAGGYDLVINLGPVFFETATRLVLTLAREKLGVATVVEECAR
ncbi:MAG: cytidylate kinase-like family protein [Verrucomicrobiales bacterium]|nr:cytidylate kinase-like family protein [Verrucomicrobiales bacterium]